MVGGWKLSLAFHCLNYHCCLGLQSWCCMQHFQLITLCLVLCILTAVHCPDSATLLLFISLRLSHTARVRTNPLPCCSDSACHLCLMPAPVPCRGCESLKWVSYDWDGEYSFPDHASLHTHNHTLTHSLSPVLVVMMRSKEFKTPRSILMLILSVALFVTEWGSQRDLQSEATCYRATYVLHAVPYSSS